MLPYISVVTPTYNRHKFLPNLIYQFQYQDYPADRMELIILDDSKVPCEFQESLMSDDRIKYHWLELDQPLNISDKRNRTNELAKGDIIICMDDDDYYPPTRVSHAVESLVNSDREIAGSTNSIIFYLKLNKIMFIGPFLDSHVVNNTMACKRSYLDNHRYETAKNNQGEERSFTRDYSEPVVQLDPFRTVICIDHGANTVCKSKLLRDYPLRDLRFSKVIPDRKIRSFYRNIDNPKRKFENNFDPKDIDILSYNRHLERIKKHLLNIGI